MLEIVSTGFQQAHILQLYRVKSFLLLDNFLLSKSVVILSICLVFATSSYVAILAFKAMETFGKSRINMSQRYFSERSMTTYSFTFTADGLKPCLWSIL